MLYFVWVQPGKSGQVKSDGGIFMEKIIVSSVLFFISAGLFLLSFRSFREKGFLFNNAYIYASKQERERMNKKPYYRQSAVVFLLLGVSSALAGTEFLLDIDWLFWLEGIIIVGTIIYAVVSCIILEKR